jgi:predicted Rdx family selenoprotein
MLGDKLRIRVDSVNLLERKIEFGFVKLTKKQKVRILKKKSQNWTFSKKNDNSNKRINKRR